MSSDMLEKKASLLTPLLLLFMVAMILANLGGYMYSPLEALYLKDLGAGIGQIGLFFTLSQIIPLSHQQSCTATLARSGFWFAQHQPGIDFLTRADDRRHSVGKGQCAVPVYPYCHCLTGVYYPCLVQVNNHR